MGIKLLILGAPYSENPDYRGTERSWPTYVESLPPEHEVNVLFRWYSNDFYKNGAVEDYDRALRYVQIYNEIVKDACFELVEVTTKNEPCVGGGCFLGYDLSSGCQSALVLLGARIAPSTERIDKPIRPLIKLWISYFRPKLNGVRLFQSYEEAEFCLDCVQSVQVLSPNVFEKDEFKVLSLFSF